MARDKQQLQITDTDLNRLYELLGEVTSELGLIPDQEYESSAYEALQGAILNAQELITETLDRKKAQADGRVNHA